MSVAVWCGIGVSAKFCGLVLVTSISRRKAGALHAGHAHSVNHSVRSRPWRDIRGSSRQAWTSEWPSQAGTLHSATLQYAHPLPTSQQQPHSEHRFPAPSCKLCQNVEEGCRKPVLGVWLSSMRWGPLISSELGKVHQRVAVKATGWVGEGERLGRRRGGGGAVVWPGSHRTDK